MTPKANKTPNSAPRASSRYLFGIPTSTFLLWLLILAYVLFFSAYSLQRHTTLNSFAADLSYIDQPMWNTLHGRFLERTLDDRQVPRIAEHLEPIIIPIALVYYLWDDVRAILIIQTIALALGALPVYWIARAQLSNRKSQISNSSSQVVPPLSVGGEEEAKPSPTPALRAPPPSPKLGEGGGWGEGEGKPSRSQTSSTLNGETTSSQKSGEWLPLVFVIVYLMSPALQAANVADFHADPFIVAPLLFAFWYASQGRYRAMWAWAVVAMLVKENLPTLTFMLGLYLLLSPENGKTETESVSENSKSGVRSNDFSRFLAHQRPQVTTSVVTTSIFQTRSERPGGHAPFFTSYFPTSPWLTRRRLHGLALMVVSLAWFYVATFLIVAPLARQVYGTEGPIYLTNRYPEFGGGLTGLLRGLLARPGDALALLREPDRLCYLAGLFASVG